MSKAPGKSYREGISLKLFQMFPDDATAEKWFVINAGLMVRSVHIAVVNVSSRIAAANGNVASGSASALERLCSVPNSVTRFGQSPSIS